MVKKAGSDNREHDLLVKDLKLNSLLEVTQAINANLSESSLYKIFQFTLLANLHVRQLALFVKDEEWICKINFGTTFDYNKAVLSENILAIHEIQEFHIPNGEQFSDFDLVIPVIHKERVLAYVLLNKKTDKGDIDRSFIQTFTNIILVAIENKKFSRRELQQEALKKEMQIARDVQGHLFPKDLPATPDFSLKALYLPHQTIGGDYYDYIVIDSERSLICIADVSGKGVPAAILMSNVQASLRTMVRYTNDLKKIVFELNDLILVHTKGDRFVTMFIGLIDFKKRELSYINAGHNPIPLHKDHEIILLDKGSTILGILPALPFIDVTVISLLKKNHLFLYTDGLSECMNEKDEEFGLEPVLPLMELANGDEQSGFIDTVLNLTLVFKGERTYNDDITMLSCFIQYS